MKIGIRFHQVPSAADLRDYIIRRIGFQLGRFAGELREVEVRLTDVNGPRNGQDIEVMVNLRTNRYGSATVQALRVEAHEAIDSAIKKAARALGRRVDRGGHRRGRAREFAVAT